MIEALRRIFKNQVVNLLSGHIVVGNAQGFASACAMAGALAIDNAGSVTLTASIITAAKLKYKRTAFSLYNSGSTASVTITSGAKMIGYYLTKQTSYANTPVFTEGTTSVVASALQPVIATDVCEGVIITIEP
jgi:hypothetical protein